jgi:hypothetical protein
MHAIHKIHQELSIAVSLSFVFVDGKPDVVAMELPQEAISSTAGIVAGPKGNTVVMLSKKR